MLANSGALRYNCNVAVTDAEKAGMAELADAPDLGSGGRPCRFKSCYPHQIMVIRTWFWLRAVLDFSYTFILQDKGGIGSDIALFAIYKNPLLDTILYNWYFKERT